MTIKAEEGVQEVSYRMDALEAPMTAEELAELGEGKEEEVKTEEVKTEEGKTEEVKTEETKIEEAIVEAEKKGGNDAEIAELRGMLRELRNENIQLAAKVAKHDRVQEGEIGKPADPTVIEELVAELKTTIDSNKQHFAQVLAVMEMNPKYEDVNTVCSSKNFEDIFEMIAGFRAEENKTAFNEEYLRAKVEVWSQPNPYKFMYDLVKEYHPDYGQAEKPAAKVEAEKPAEKPAAKTAAEVVKERKPAVAPASVAGLGGGGANEQAGWTAARIDAMPETELHKVPKDVYSAYLRGELDI